MTDQRHVDALHEIIRTLSNLVSMISDPMQVILVDDLIEKAKRALEEPVGPIVDAEATETILELEMPPYRLFGVGPVMGGKIHAWNHTVFGGGGYRTECGAYTQTVKRERISERTDFTNDDGRYWCKAPACDFAIRKELRP